MKKYLFLTLLISLFVWGCEKQDPTNENTNADKVDVTLTPSLVVTFDHVPTMKEMIEVGKNIIANPTKDQPVTDLEYPDANQEKLVILGVKTANYENAGTDKAANCRFIGRWVNNYGSYKTVAYILDKTNRDDLNRNSYNAFYYFITNESNVADQFVSGRLKNTASDGWLCSYVDFQDVSCSGSRSVTLYWGDPETDWVQSDGNQLSSEKFSNLTTWLYYQNCNN